MLSTILLPLLLLIDTPVVERLGIKGPLMFQGKSYELAWTSHPSDDYYIQEYLPKGQKPESFKEMLTVNVLRGDKEPHVSVMEKMQWLEQRKTSDAVCQYSLLESPDGAEFLLDFILSESKDGALQTVEFNMYRYRRIEIDGKKALLCYIFSKRAYGDEITPFLEWLKAGRAEMLNAFVEVELPLSLNRDF